MEHHQRASFPRISTVVLALALAALALMGCGSSAEADPDFVVADLFATPGKEIATIALSATPPPSPTVPNVPTTTPAPTLPLPTAILLHQPTQPVPTSGPTPTRELDVLPTATPIVITCSDPPDPFFGAWQNISGVQDALGCPAGSPRRIYGVWQFYQQGGMFWRESDGSIFVISDRAFNEGQSTDTWWRLADTYTEGEAITEDVQPPEGLTRPVRGFGKVWENNGFVRDALGWATSEEIGYETLWLDFDSGWMMTTPGDDRVYTLVPLDDPPHSTGLNYGHYP